MTGYLTEFDRFECAKLSAAEEGSATQYACERVYELLVEAANDINQELCIDAGREIPATYRDSFLALAELGVVEEGEANLLAAVTRLRNRLVHDYEDTE